MCCLFFFHSYVGLVTPNGPADHGGLMVGDRLLEIDGVPLQGESKEFVDEVIASTDDSTSVKVSFDPAGYRALVQSGQVQEPHRTEAISKKLSDTNSGMLGPESVSPSRGEPMIDKQQLPLQKVLGQENASLKEKQVSEVIGISGKVERTLLLDKSEVDALPLVFDEIESKVFVLSELWGRKAHLKTHAANNDWRSPEFCWLHHPAVFICSKRLSDRR